MSKKCSGGRSLYQTPGREQELRAEPGGDNPQTITEAQMATRVLMGRMQPDTAGGSATLEESKLGRYRDLRAVATALGPMPTFARSLLGVARPGIRAMGGQARDRIAIHATHGIVCAFFDAADSRDKDVEIVFSPKEADCSIGFLARNSTNLAGTLIGYVLSLRCDQSLHRELRRPNIRFRHVRKSRVFRGRP
jgi:hypothetical protein